MSEKAVISGYTYRSLDSQRETFKGLPVFVLPDDESALFRKTTRKQSTTIRVASFAVLAKDERAFRTFMESARDMYIVSDEGQTIPARTKIENALALWRDARRRGATKIGAARSGAKKKAAAEERAKGMTKAEWTDGAIRNAQLVQKYGCAINTLKRIASDRGWGWNRQHAIILAEEAQKRKERRNVKAN